MALGNNSRVTHRLGTWETRERRYGIQTGEIQRYQFVDHGRDPSNGNGKPAFHHHRDGTGIGIGIRDNLFIHMGRRGTGTGTGVKSVSARTQRVVSLLVVWWGEGREGGSGVDGGQKGDGDGDRGEGFRFF